MATHQACNPFVIGKSGGSKRAFVILALLPFSREADLPQLHIARKLHDGKGSAAWFSSVLFLLCFESARFPTSTVGYDSEIEIKIPSI